MEHEEDFRLQGQKTRRELRALVVSKFLEEAPGEGKGNLTSKYRYNVEQLADGRRIYLRRPAPLKLGFDFVVHVEGVHFESGGSNPSHDDILNDLKDKRWYLNDASTSKLRRVALQCMRARIPDDVLLSQYVFETSTGFSLEMVLKVLKWLWIEQDIRYWNLSGRRMLKAAVDRALGGS